MSDKKCSRCGCNATPVLYGPVGVKPCGLAPSDNKFYVFGKIEGCPMSDWQDGYLDAMKSSAESPPRPATTPTPEKEDEESER